MKPKNSLLQSGLLLPFIALTLSLQANATDLSTVPLSTYFAPSSIDVKPNIMFVLDDSGSMGMTSMPDQATWYYTDWYAGYRPGNYNSSRGDNGMPPYMRYNSAFNGLAYNPAIRYLPPRKFNANNTEDTTTYLSMTGTSTATGGDNTATTAAPNWKDVKRDAYGTLSTSKDDLSDGVFSHVVVPGLYCNNPDLRTCNAQSGPSGSYTYPASLRWCTTASLTTCRATWLDSYTYPSMPAPRIATLTVGGSGNTSVDNITVNGLRIIPSATATYSSSSDLATAIRDKINACSNVKTGNCDTVGFTATVNNAEVTIYAPDANTATLAISKTGSRTVTATSFDRSTIPLPYWRDTGVTPSASSAAIPGENLRHTITPLVNSYPYPGQATKAVGRDDCAGTTCTYAEEMTNYANWYAYYRTRMQMMKTSASRAFAGIDSAADITAGVSRFRVGYMSINNTAGSQFLNLGEFVGQQRADWFGKLFTADTGSGTPLREALAKAGRLYAGKLNGDTLNGVAVTDPLQWSCQQNFTILSTDGFWNSGAGFKLDGSSSVGNQDGAMPAPYNDGGVAQNQTRTSSLQSRTETQRAERGTLQSAIAQLQTRTSQLQKRTNALETRTRASSGSSWTAWASVPAGSTCTWDTNYPNRRECRYVGWSTYADESTSCTPNALDTSTSNNSVWEVGVGCQYANWTGWTNTTSCSAVNRDTSGTWNVPVARECQNLAGTYTDATTCSVTTPDASGQSTQCRYNWAALAPTQTCSPTYAAGDFSNVTVYRNCDVTNGSWANAATCTETTDWSASGTRTACQYTNWSNWSDTSTCTAVAQSSAPDFTVATARECQAVTGSGGYSNTLADVAAYYYNNDLRRPTSDNPPAADATGTCDGPIIAPKTTANDLCNNNVTTNDRDVATWQHMTTFTLGLGAQGKMLFSPSYWTDTSGDFNSVKTGQTADPANGICQWMASGSRCVWPQPSSDDPANIDDLWHAAVNGRGSYFSATDPNSLSEGLGDTLRAITDFPRPGTSAAAASSNPNISAGDNYVFSSYYKSVDWYGDLYRQRFDLTTNNLSQYVDWSAKTMLDCAMTQWQASTAYVAGDAFRYGTACRLVLTGYVSGTTYNDGNKETTNTALVSDAPANCSTAWAPATAYTAGSIYSYGGVCRYVTNAYTSGTSFGLTDSANSNAAYVAGTPTSRTIYTKDSSGRIPFEWTSLNSTQQSYFTKPHIAYDESVTPPVGLSQFCSPAGGTCLSSAEQNNVTVATSGAAGEALVNFLRGERTNELTFYRQRKHVLGDIVSSEARYVSASLFNYNDANYSAFKVTVANRQNVVYVAGNDGMLHAFDGETGKELWAYVPAMVLPELYKLADRDYSQKHEYFVDGTPEVGDICPNANNTTPAGTCSATQWKTILVGGLNRGGKGFYALDITNPTNPVVLWEFTDANMGYSYGNPRITKLKSGQWVVILTSGYNSTDGLGRLYVLDAYSGNLIRSIQTTAGTPSNPSGLTKIAAHAPNADTNNTTLAVYGGDMLGNLWRFDINGDIGASGYDAHRMVTFMDESGTPQAQPITTKPIVTTVEGKPVVYVGTGSYLGITDITNTQYQTMYAVKDNYNSTSFLTPRANNSGFVEQTLQSATCTTETSCTPGEAIRKIGAPDASKPVQTVSWTSNNGWYVDFLTAGERSNTDPALALGSLVFTTNTPNNASVEPCGETGTDNSSSWLYTLDNKTGGPVGGSGGVVATSLGNVIATRPVLVRTPDGTVFALIRTSGGSSSTTGGGGGGSGSTPAGYYPGAKEDGATQVKKPPINLSGGASRRVSWREITTD